MTEFISGPGLLHVRSRIATTSKDILDEKTFLRWYDDEHITEVVNTSGIKTGFRYTDVNGTSDPSNPKPFLAVYPLDDMAFTLSSEFKKISVQSENLPASGVIYDMVDFDVSYMAFDTKSGNRGSGDTHAKYILTCGLRPSTSHSMDSFLTEQISQLSQSPGYIRSLTFHLQYARTNAESRKLKGLPAADEAHLEPSTWLAMHEFELQPGNDVVVRLKDELSSLGEKFVEVFVWRLERVHGEGKMF